MTQPFATPEGTARYVKRFEGAIPEGHFRESLGLNLSTIGIGTYLGANDDETDARYRESVGRAVELGCNVIDTAINYRCQRSERSVGKALEGLFREGKASRDEIVVATKGGYVPFDTRPPDDMSRYLAETYVSPGIVGPDEIAAGGWHCLSPRFLEDQIGRSLANLGLSCIDIYYVHNPEQQLEDVPRDEFDRRMARAFELLEKQAADGRIRVYGAATWDGFRRPPDHEGFLNLLDLMRIAFEIAGEENHFRAIQLPYNLAMAEALVVANQPFGDELTCALDVADRLDMAVAASASILQGRLAADIPETIGEHLRGLATDAQRSIQFVRSTPGITTALVGMSRPAHVEENLKLAAIPPAPWDDMKSLLTDDTEEA